MIIVGVDPGGSHAAIVVRDGTDLIESVYLERAREADRASWVEGCWVEAEMLATKWQPTLAGVEDVEAPNPHVGRRRRDGSDRGARIIDPGPSIETALCAGALLAVLRRLCPTLLIKPAGFGAPLDSRAMLLAAYPAELVGPRETTGAGKSKWQHLRSAWDVADATWRDARQRPFIPAYVVR